MKQASYLDNLPPAPPSNGNGNKPPHNFRQSLAAAEDGHYESFWEEAYRKAFPALVLCASLQGDTVSQRQGKDRLIHLPNGQSLYIQEKIRPTRRDDSDIAIEYEHRFTNGTIKPGWIAVDQDIHYLAYGFAALRRVYLFPWHQLRQAWRIHGSIWKNTYAPVVAPNGSYDTYSCPVPTRELRGAVAKASRIDLDG